MTTTVPAPTRAPSDAAWLRLVRLSLPVLVAGLVAFWALGTFWETVDGGDFEYVADYWYTAMAIPLGVPGILYALGFHRLQHGRDGRLGVVGFWIYALCLAELVVQCSSSVVVGAELRWGPTYVLCSTGTLLGLALLSAGSWRVGLLPRWMLGVWPPLWLFGSFFGGGPIPLVLAAFLVAFGVVLTRRARSRSVVDARH